MAAYRFGPFRLEDTERRLLRDGRPIRLAPKAFDTLLLLVGRAGSLVTREMLLETVWSGAYVEEGNVTHAIWQLRRALEDGTGGERYIETVPRAGYRFVAPVHAEVAGQPVGGVVAGSLPAGGPSLAPAETPRAAADVPIVPGATSYGRPRRPLAGRRAGLAALGALLIVGAVGAGWSLRRDSRARPPLAIAVLPFEPIGESADRHYLTAGLTEEVVAALGQLDPKRLNVVGRTSTLAFRGSREPFSVIGRELGADYLLEGATRSEAGQLRVTARLLRASDQVQVWSAAYERRVTSTLDVQRELSVAIAEAVRLELAPGGEPARARPQTADAEAYDLYLRGRYLWRRFTPQTNAQAIDFFEQATARDPTYALAWAGIAQVLGGSTMNGDVSPATALPRARAAADRAVALAPTLPEAHGARGLLEFFALDFAAAEVSLRRSLELDPGDSFTHLLLGHVRSQRGDHAGGAESTARARRLEPFFPMTHAISSQVAYQARDGAGALEHARRALSVDPQFWIGHIMMGQALELLGRRDEALESFVAAAHFSGGNSKALALQTAVLASLGRSEEAQELLALLGASAGERFVPPSSLAIAHAGLGERREALDLLEQAHAARDVQLMFLPVDPRWDALRDEPRFVALLRRFGFADRELPTGSGRLGPS